MAGPIHLDAAEEAILALVREATRARVAPRADAIDREGEFPNGLCVPPEYGGPGASTLRAERPQTA